VVDNEPARRRVVDDEWRDEPRDEPRDVPRHPEAVEAKWSTTSLREAE
jgi:hypothetical protein